MFCGKVWGGAPGQTDAMLLSIKGSSFSGGIRALVTLQPQYTDRNLAIVANGIFLGARFASYKPLEIIVPATPGNTLDSLYIEDIGRMSEVPEDVVPYILGNARKQDAITSKRLEFEWDVVGKYKQTSVFGDAQLSAITITGAVRGLNVAGVPEFPARGRLHYSLENYPGVATFVRWWADTTLVAEGYGTGSSETVTCQPVNGSGLTVVCTYTYSTPVKRGTAWIDLKWPASFKLYWSTSAINYANPPQDTMPNNGSDVYSYVSAEQVPGTYYWNVVAVDDEGQPESAPTTPPDTITLNTVPDAPVITSVTQLSPSNFRVNYTAAAGPTKTCYFSKVNAPINFGNLNAGPAPVVGGATFADITIPAFTPQDNTTDYATMVTAINAAVATANTAFSAGPSAGFPAAFATFRTTVQAAVATYAAALRFALQEIQDTLKQHGDSVYSYASNIDTLASADWKPLMGVIYGEYLAALGRMIDGNAARYAMPNGAIAGSDQAGASVGTTSYGAGGEASPSDIETLYNIGQPFLKPNMVRLVVRCSSGGIEEQNNAVYELELDASGNLKNPNPPPAILLSSSLSYVSGNDYSFTVQGAVRDEGFDGTATLIDVYVHDATTTFDPATATPDATITLPSTGISGLRAGTVTFTKDTSTFPWRKIILLARTAAGKRSVTWDEQRSFAVSNDTPLAVGNLKGRALKSRGV